MLFFKQSTKHTSQFYCMVVPAVIQIKSGCHIIWWSISFPEKTHCHTHTIKQWRSTGFTFLSPLYLNSHITMHRQCVQGHPSVHRKPYAWPQIMLSWQRRRAWEEGNSPPPSPTPRPPTPWSFCPALCFLPLLSCFPFSLSTIITFVK